MSARAVGAAAVTGVRSPTVILYCGSFALVAAGAVAAAVTARANDGALALDRFAAASVAGGHVGAWDVGWLGALTASAFAPPSGTAAFVASLIALATFALVERRARRAGGRIFALAATAVAGGCALGSFGFAGGLPSALFALLLAEALDARGRTGLVSATIIAVVWCNTAAQGLLAPALAFVFALGAHLERAGASECRERRLACIATALATLATPRLFAYPAIAFDDLRVDRALAGVVAFHPVDVAALAYRIGFFGAALAAFAVGMRRSRPGGVLVFVGAGFLALANGAYLPVFGALAAPVLAAAAAETFGRFEVRFAAVRGDAALAIFALALATAASAAFGARAAAPADGYALAATLARDGRAHRLYCANVDWCDAALVAASPTRVFMDGRVGAYPRSVWVDQAAIARAKKPWRALLAKRGVDAVLARTGRPLAELLALSPGWTATANDAESVMYERTAAR